MTQRSMAQQIAEAQNIITALSKKIEEQIEAPQPERKVSNFLIKYDDGTEQWFVPETSPTTANILSQLRDRSAKREVQVADDPLPAKQRLREGFECIIDGVKYNSIVHASRVLGMCRNAIKSRLDKGAAGYEYV